MDSPDKLFKDLNKVSSNLRNTNRNINIWTLHNKIIYILNNFNKLLINDLVDKYIDKNNKPIINEMIDIINQDTTRCPETYKEKIKKINIVKLKIDLKRSGILQDEEDI